MKNLSKTKLRLFDKIRRLYQSFKLKETSWKGAIYALILITLVLFIIQGYYFFFNHGTLDFIKATFLWILVAIVIGGIFALLISIFRLMPIAYIWAFISSLILLTLCFVNMVLLKGTLIIVLAIIIVFTIFGAAIYNLFENRFAKSRLVKKGFIILGLIIGLISISLGGYWLNDKGTPRDTSLNVKDIISSKNFQMSLGNPSEPGNYQVKQLSYGSGQDLHRTEYGTDVNIITKTVDGSAFIENWSSSRTKYLGFDPKNLPINGLVWYPEEDGKFPLVIMVHGNHEMVDYSDTGYAYLGELLASRGFIFVSIDENFLNLSLYNDMIFFHGLKDEGDARGWLVLEHLKTWENWNRTEGNRFYNTIDMNSIAVIGHSRGGEAAAIAAVFNKLKAYPDNGNIKFDYNFNIRSIVAIAPVDKMNQPAGKGVELTDISYLTLHGAHDMDVSSFQGSNQYDRIKFTQKNNKFKASVYILGANHGQFNQNWGRNDFIGLGIKLFNTKQLIPQIEQEEIAEVLITAFLEATLKNKNEYTKIFRDIRYAEKWLPNTIYLNNYADAKTTFISTFEEDIDLNTTTIFGGELFGQNLTLWKEDIVPLKFGQKDTSAVFLGWDKTKNPNDAIYTVNIPNERLTLQEGSKLVFGLAEGETDKNNDINTPIDFTVKVIDKNGNEAALPLSHFSYLQPKLEAKIGKATVFQVLASSEIVFQLFEFDLLEFKKVNPEFEPIMLSKICFIFNKTEKGAIVLDDIGIRE